MPRGRARLPARGLRPRGYTHLLGVLADPGHDEHDGLVEWVGGPFDPTAIEVVAVNVALQHVR